MLAFNDDSGYVSIGQTTHGVENGETHYIYVTYPDLNAALDFGKAQNKDQADAINIFHADTDTRETFDYMEEDIYDKKIIPVSSLFGPHKYRGAILKKFNYQQKKFSHQRIFGVKNPHKRRYRYGNKPHHYNNKSNDGYDSKNQTEM